MSVISGEKILHPDGTLRLNQGRFIPFHVNQTQLTWLEHVVISPGQTPDQDRIMVRQCCVNEEPELGVMDLCWFVRGKPNETHSCSQDGVYGNRAYEWKPYVEYPCAYS